MRSIDETCSWRRSQSAAALWLTLASLIAAPGMAGSAAAAVVPGTERLLFERTISREVLENYLSRAITMEGMLNGRGDLDDNIRMLKDLGAKFIGRSLCLWGGEAALMANLERARQQSPKIHAADPEMVLQACIFEIVTTQVDQVPVPGWAFAALSLPEEKRNFRYEDMLYPDGRFRNHWRPGQSVPDVSRPETRLWFYFLGASFIDAGCEALHFGQTELMNGNDRNLDHYAQVLALIRSYAAKHARRHMVLCDSHVPSGGLVRNGQLLMDFHSFPLRIMETPDKPREAILKLGFSDGIYRRSKGGTTFSGWKCEQLPYLVEIDNWGVSKTPGQPKSGGIWIWGYDEISWFAHQGREYRSNWLQYAWDWVRQTDPNGYLQMPGSRTLAGPVGPRRWYYANNPSEAVPDGFGDEAAIRAVWSGGARHASAERARVFVLTDISNEPDDEESMVRFLVYANDYDVEGIAATTSTWLRSTTRVDLVHRQIEAYAQVYPNLCRHSGGYPGPAALHAVAVTGQPGYGMASTGEGRTSAGSELLLAAAAKADDRPLWVSVWGGANTLAQALLDARASRTGQELERLIARLRVYSISDQDDAGPWLRREFPGLCYVVSPSTPDWKEYCRATWSGISGDRHYRNGPFHKFDLVDNPWLEENVIRNHGPLGALYPRLAYIMEGDTPSFLGLVNNGLGWHVNPGYGGWGGRYVLYRAYGETRPIWTNNHDSRDTVATPDGQATTSDQATIWRWREHFQHDFAARMDWCVASRFDQANHNPVAVLNGDRTRRVLALSAKAGQTVELSAAGSSDPDGHEFTSSWFVYPEAGTLKQEVKLSATAGERTSLAAPAVKSRETVHIILQLEDRGSPALIAYRRAIVTVDP